MFHAIYIYIYIYIYVCVCKTSLITYFLPYLRLIRILLTLATRSCIYRGCPTLLPHSYSHFTLQIPVLAFS